MSIEAAKVAEVVGGERTVGRAVRNAGDLIAAVRAGLPAATVEYVGRTLQVTPYGTFVFGVGRDATGDAVVRIRQPATGWIEHRVAITPRDWPVEHINGVPPATVNPPKAIAERIEREQAQTVVRGNDCGIDRR